MKKMIIIAVALFLIVMLGTTLSKKPSPEQPKSVVPKTSSETLPKEQAVPLVEDPNGPKTLSEACFVIRHNARRIRELEGEIRALEERLAKLEANEKKSLYQQKRLENQLRSLEQKGFYRK